MPPLNFDYAASKAYAEHLGLCWPGDEYLVHADREAHALGMTQEQIDAGMRHHLWLVKNLFDPANYTFAQRLAIVWRFVMGG